MDDKISVIMPAYNVESYIGKSIESVLEQTYRNFELIIVNDGSQDSTSSVIKEYQMRDNRIKYVEQINQGVSAARNTGIKKADGKYISFLDADDLWTKDALEKMYHRMINTSDCHFVYGRTEEIFLSGEKQLVGPNDIVNGYLEDFIHKTNELRLRMHISAMLIEKNILLENDIFFPVGIKISEDTGFIIKVLAVISSYGINDVTSYYMRREDSATAHAWLPKDWEGQITIYDVVLPFVQMARPQAIDSFYRMRNYVSYRFVLHCIRSGFLQEAHTSLNRWESYLRDFVHGDGRFADRIKCRAILWAQNSDKLLNLIGIL